MRSALLLCSLQLADAFLVPSASNSLCFSHLRSRSGTQQTRAQQGTRRSRFRSGSSQLAEAASDESGEKPDDEGSEKPEATNPEAHRHREDYERAMLQAERLRWQAEREQLALEREKLQSAQLKSAKQKPPDTEAADSTADSPQSASSPNSSSNKDTDALLQSLWADSDRLRAELAVLEAKPESERTAGDKLQLDYVQGQVQCDVEIHIMMTCWCRKLSKWYRSSLALDCHMPSLH